MNDYPTNVGSIQTPGFQICWDDVDSHREEVGATKSSDQADIPSRAQSATTYNDQEFLSVGEFVGNEPLGELPRDTLPGLDLWSGHEPKESLARASPTSDIKKSIHDSVSHLINENTEDVEKVHAERHQREIEAQRPSQSKVWLRQQLAQQRDEVAKEHWAQNKKHWDATEGMRLKEHY
ncbi:MAG: hypothetical protein Q9198_004140 [Flavoplaca austrocitrina]